MSGGLSRVHRLTEALTVIAALLESPRDRLGRLEYLTEDAARNRENLRLLALEYGVAPARDVLAQAANVARAALAKAAEPVTRRGGK